MSALWTYFVRIMEVMVDVYISIRYLFTQTNTSDIYVIYVIADTYKCLLDVLISSIKCLYIVYT